MNVKTLITLALSLVLFRIPAAPLLEEHFSYANGNLGASGIGSALWTGGDSASAAITVNSTATLTHSALSGIAGSGVIFSGGTFKKKAAPFAAQTSGTVYCSFLLNVQTAPSTVKAFLYFRTGNSATSSPELGVFLNGNAIGLGKKVSSPAVSTTLNTNTHLIVCRYTFLSGNDQVDLWVDPVSLGDNGNIPAATLTTGTASSSDATQIDYLFLNHAASQTLWIDEVRVGASWADVTPANGVTPPSPALRVDDVSLVAGGLVMRGTNGSANAIYGVLTSTNLALPLEQWTLLATNAFNAGGGFICTNPVSPADPRRFYRLQVGNLPSFPPTAPVIASQPQDRSAAAGDTAAFSVGATGTAPLHYQWYFNTGTPLGNATGASITLTNVQPGDAGGYSVVITNIAGAVTSVVATLTVTNLLAPPAITAQPQNQAVTEGQTAHFSVTVTGTAPLHYQWYFNTNTPLADATNALLTLNSVTTNDAGGYSVVVSNNYGATNSLTASLTVNPPPTNTGPVQILEAEDGTFTGSASTDYSGYTGSGFVDTVNATGSYVEIEFGRQQAGTGMLVVRYAQGKTDNRTASVTLNGVEVVSSLDFPPTGSFSSWQTVSNSIPVAAGRNVLRLTALTSGGLANLDHFEITGAPQYRLAVTLSGRGSVGLSPSNAFGYFNPGTSVTLTAQPLTNAAFLGWSGALSGTNNPETLAVSSNLSVTATFQNAQAFNLYVSPAGNDANPGTIDAPFYSLHTAVAAAFPGDVIYMRGGTYYYTNTVFLAAHNSSNNPVLITAYPGEHPVLSWTSWAPANEDIRGAARGLKVTGSYWHLKGLEICYAPDNGVKCEGHHITFEQCVFHHNGDGGLQIGLNKDTYSSNPDPEHLAAYVYVLNCDAYRNADPATSYENADGFSCKLYAGIGNRFYGCRAWENCDDGWDCYQTEYEIVIENCWAWHNGDPSMWGFSSFNGDGNGFKLGGDNTYCLMLIKNCVALNCQWGTTVGFAFNNNTAPNTLYNCSALNCGRPYKFEQNGNVFKNCLDYNSTRPAPADISGSSTQQNNSWNLGITATAGDFIDFSETNAAAPRQTDGSLPDNGFARLSAGSNLIDRGVDVGLPWCGTAPDLGAYEFCPP
jgi:pectate disaccharide-lyase